VETPADLASALAKDRRAGAAWEELSFTRRKELARGIEQARKPETRARRLLTALDELRAQSTRRR